MAVNAGFAAGIAFYNTGGNGLPGNIVGEIEADVDASVPGGIKFIDANAVLNYQKTNAAIY